jgi:hypothetical protein
MQVPNALRRYYQQFLTASPEEMEVCLQIYFKEVDE